MISLGLLSGPTSSALEICCRKVMQVFELERKKHPEKPMVNVVFHSPLAITKPHFEGLIIGKFSKKKRAVVVAVAVPMSVTEMTDNDVLCYIQKTLHQAADYGIDYMMRCGVCMGDFPVHKFIDGCFAPPVSYPSDFRGGPK